MRIVIADDHDIVRRGVRQLLRERPDWEVCGESVTGREAVTMIKNLVPNVAILDLAMPELNGLDATRQVRAAVPATEVLIFTMHDSEQLIRDALAAGARGYLLKSDAARDIIPAVKAVAQHRPYFNQKTSDMMLDNARTGDGAMLISMTRREREILQLLAEGNSNKQISSSLDISVKTVETHRATIMRKLNAHSVVEIVRFAMRNKLAAP